MYSPADLPSRTRAAPAKKRMLSEATGISSFADPSGLPTFCDSSSASSSACWSSASASFSSISARSPGVVSSHSGRAFFAACTARSTSSALERGTSAIVSPVAGFSTSMVSPPAASTHSPPTRFWCFETVVLTVYLLRRIPVSRVRRCAIVTGSTVMTITKKTTTFTCGSCWPSLRLPRIQIGSVF